MLNIGIHFLMIKYTFCVCTAMHFKDKLLQWILNRYLMHANIITISTIQENDIISSFSTRSKTTSQWKKITARGNWSLALSTK